MSEETRKQREAIKRGDAGSVIAGKVDRGNPLAPFEAISFNIARKTYLRTRHWSEAKALINLRSRSRHHEQRKMIDHNERFDANKNPLPKRVIHL